MGTGRAAGQLVSLAFGGAWGRGDVIVFLLRMHHPYPFSFYPNSCYFSFSPVVYCSISPFHLYQPDNDRVVLRLRFAVPLVDSCVSI